MKLKVLTLFFCLLFSSFVLASAEKNEPKAIRITPPAPLFTEVERRIELAKRRAKVAAAMSDNSIMILLSTEPKIYTGDIDFMYRQENNLYYLTNLKQKNTALVLIKEGAETKEILFLPKRNPAAETWSGAMYSRNDAEKISGIKTITDAAELNNFLQSVKEKKPFPSKDSAISNPTKTENIYLLLPINSFDSDSKREFRKEIDFVSSFAKVSVDEKTSKYKYETTNGDKIENAQPIFAELRLTKSPVEIKLLQHAIDITIEALMRSMAMVERANWEYEVQAEVEYTFRRRNADYWGYPSIVGCGPNATTLHYEEAQGKVEKGDLMLMDVGAEYDHYTADVTRTFPVNGKFTKEQAEIYKIVYDAQEAAAKAIKPGAKFNQPKRAATETIERGLARLGLITELGAFVPSTVQEVPDGKGGKRIVGIPQYALWFMHGWGHWLGMNVHDVGDYDKPFKAGMVTTNEPGIYIRENALDYLPDTPANKEFIAKVRPAFEKYKNIGVRIEDDMLVTDKGVEWMTKALPRSIADIEAFMAKASKEMNYSRLPPTNPRFAFLSYNNDLSWKSFAANNFLSGKTMRRGWIYSEKSAAYSDLNHAEHSHGE
ncbi:MAG: aminopeptidase P family protein [Acidobacteria bacterium]|jgi:Xaa-Pro aminopeptidase|nr:aminopeptidase P family protein [Acidobacteriota bacterium]